MTRIFFCLIFAAGLLFSSESRKSISEEGPYCEFCHLAANDEEVFNTFRQHPIYCEILEHVTCEVGKLYLDLILQSSPGLLSKLLSNFEKFKTSDTVGSPMTCKYPFIGNFSPSTLRYIKILSDFLSLWDLDQKKILEIGAGYGGQCKIINDVCAFQEYAIIDLKEPLELIKKFLGVFGIEPRLILPEESCPESFDFIISNYAFSECNKDLQDLYLKSYLLRSKAGYMLLNDMRQYLSPPPYSAEEIQGILIENGYSAEILAEVPFTAPGNVLLIWNK